MCWYSYQEFTLPSPVLEEKRAATDVVMEGRDIMVDAAIVRNMKALRGEPIMHRVRVCVWAVCCDEESALCSLVKGVNVLPVGTISWMGS